MRVVNTAGLPEDVTECQGGCHTGWKQPTGETSKTKVFA